MIVEIGIIAALWAGASFVVGMAVGAVFHQMGGEA